MPDDAITPEARQFGELMIEMSATDGPGGIESADCEAVFWLGCEQVARAARLTGISPVVLVLNPEAMSEVLGPAFTSMWLTARTIRLRRRLAELEDRLVDALAADDVDLS